MANFYATRTVPVATDLADHQLLKFDSAAARERFVFESGARPIAAREAAKLRVADTWRTYRSAEASCVFHAARYIPA